MPPEPQPEVVVCVQSEAPLALAATSGAGTAVDVDDDESNESGIESGESSATTSVSSSVFCFTYANGRRYHSDRFKSADYFLPNDETEQARLDLYHHIFLSLLGGKLYTAPLEKPQRVLDVGTGTGIWAIDFADEHPEAMVIGTDISPIQPSWVPANLKFEVDDMEEEWTYADNYFDYIHIRSLGGSFSDWDKVLKQAYDKTTPGGYIEIQDYGGELFRSDGTLCNQLDPDEPGGTWFYHFEAAGLKFNRPMVVCRGMKKRLEKAGFVDVCERTAIWPLGPWPKDKRLKEIGKWGRIGAIESAYPFALHLLTKAGWDVPSIREMVDRAIEAFKTRKYYCHGWFIYGRKPE